MNAGRDRVKRPQSSQHFVSTARPEIIREKTEVMDVLSPKPKVATEIPTRTSMIAYSMVVTPDWKPRLLKNVLRKPLLSFIASPLNLGTNPYLEIVAERHPNNQAKSAGISSASHNPLPSIAIRTHKTHPTSWERTESARSVGPFQFQDLRSAGSPER